MGDYKNNMDNRAEFNDAMFEGKDIIDGRYIIIGKLGSGGFSTVQKAYDKHLRMPVALKKLKSSESSDESNLLSEMEILKGLKHRYLTRIYDLISYKNQKYIVIDYIDGESFSDLLSKGERFSQKDIINWAIQLCDVLDYLHTRKPPIIHSDIKPGNIMLNRDRDICLIDFNISYLLTKDAHAIACTPSYVSPEQYTYSEGKTYGAEELMKLENQNRDTRTETARLRMNNFTYETPGVPSEIFSLGATLYHLATGHTVNKLEVVNGNISFENANISDALINIISKALEYKPINRYSSALIMKKNLENWHKSENTFKSFALKENVISIVLIFAIGLGIIFGTFGLDKQKDEKSSRYDEYVELMETGRAENNEENFDKSYTTAIRLYPDRLDAYYEKSLLLYESNEYDDAIDYITKTAEQYVNDEQPDMSGDIYFILGNCYFEKEDYEDSLNAYQNALKYNKNNSEYYRDYAISLARTGRLDKAKEMLEEISKNDSDKADISMVKGEIDFAEEKYNDAIDCFKECIDSDFSDYFKMRSYVMYAKSYLEQKTTDSYKNAIEVLNDAKLVLPEDQSKTIMDLLSNTYISLGNDTGDKEYYQDALDVLKQSAERGWSTITSNLNMSMIYQNLDDLDSARDILEKLKEQYPDNYNIYKRLAFVEADYESKQDNESRNYKVFEDYYNKAKELYEKQQKNGSNDSEMDLLKNIYNELSDGNWFK